MANRTGTNRNTNDLVWAVKDIDGSYFCGNNKWDKQIRKAQLYRSEKYALAAANSMFRVGKPTVVKVRIFEVVE